MRDRFSSDEWDSLKVLPTLTFMFGALGDGDFSRPEMMAAAIEVMMPENTRNSLHSAILEDMQGGLGDAPGSLEEITQGVEDCKRILREKLDEDEYQSFASSLIVSAAGIAQADGMDDGEAGMIAALAMLLEVDQDALSAEMSLYGGE